MRYTRCASGGALSHRTRCSSIAGLDRLLPPFHGERVVEGGVDGVGAVGAQQPYLFGLRERFAVFVDAAWRPGHAITVSGLPDVRANLAGVHERDQTFLVCFACRHIVVLRHRRVQFNDHAANAVAEVPPHVIVLLVSPLLRNAVSNPVVGDA